METFVSPLLQPAGLVVGFLAALFLGISQQKRLGGGCDWNGRTEKRKAHRIFVCHLAISTSLVIWHLLAHRRVRASICGIHLGKDALMARRSDAIYQRGRLEGLGKDA